MFADHLDLALPLYWTVDRALDEATCRAYVARYHAARAEQAPVITERGTVVDVSRRDNSRVMWDDAGEANRLVDTVRSQIPGRWRTEHLHSGNPRLRLYCYEPGQHHTAHWDTVVELADDLRSRLTLVFYLNDDFTGGHTDFPELGVTIEPRVGRALVFQHRVLHAAMPVEHGAKLVLRTDVLFASARREP